MSVFQVAAVLVSLAAALAYLNERFVHLPSTIGLMLIALLLSLGTIAAGSLGFMGAEQLARSVLEQVDFSQTLMHGMLSFLLFAAALHVNLDDLASRRWVILSLATLGVVVSTFLVGTATWLIFEFLGLPMPFVYCLLFGAVISPTDPIAVLGILRTARVSKLLEIKIVGESLFNDGVAVVLFVVLVRLAAGDGQLGPDEIAWLFVEEAVGGILYGLAIGAVAFYLIKTVQNRQVEVLVTLAVVMGGYFLATLLDVSGPIAMVVAGLLIGNHGRYLAMSAETRHYLDVFWELIDGMLNAILFVLIGMEVLVLSFRLEYFAAAALAIPMVVLARFLGIGLLVGPLRSVRRYSPGVVPALTWAGIRGGVSVALALSLPPDPYRAPILAVTYCVVVFSILVQGLTLGPFIVWLRERHERKQAAARPAPETK